MSTWLNRYEQALEPARARYAGGRWVTHYIAGTPDPDTLERFLIHFCALGYRMTRPVEGWIRRAGERSVALGLDEVGTALVQHARHEAGHEVLMANDARALSDRRARAGRSSLDVEALLAMPATPGIEGYVRLHEETIAGSAPCAQIAIEYEIERLPAAFGDAFVQRCAEVLGDDVRSCLSFLEDHGKLDVGHTQFNSRQLGRLLEQRPDLFPALVTAGAAALDAHRAFMEDCIRLAEHPA